MKYLIVPLLAVVFFGACTKNESNPPTVNTGLVDIPNWYDTVLIASAHGDYDTIFSRNLQGHSYIERKGERLRILTWQYAIDNDSVFYNRQIFLIVESGDTVANGTALVYRKGVRIAGTPVTSELYYPKGYISVNPKTAMWPKDIGRKSAYSQPF